MSLLIWIFSFFLLSLSVKAQLTINGGISSRFDQMVRRGDVPQNYNNTISAVDGHYALFLKYAQSVDSNYKVGFNCITVATTADGASKGFTQKAVPVTHDWDQFFAGSENFAQNRGGFASYGNVNGDSNGPMCNDELNSFILTPAGKFTAGNMVNPMRRLYDDYTVNPVWGNQRGYYVLADLRANALQYSVNWGALNVVTQINSASDSNAPNSETSQDKAYTALIGYEIYSGTALTFGYIENQGDWDAKQVKGSPTVRHKALGIAAKTQAGRLNFGYTMMSGSMTHTNDVGIEISQIDHTFKLSFASEPWEFILLLSIEKMNWYTPKSMGGNYTIAVGESFIGQTFNSLDNDRSRADIWALYDLGKGAKTYLRIDSIQKNYTAPEIPDWKATMTVTLIEGGWMINF
jgi:hypothetical protein